MFYIPKSKRIFVVLMLWTVMQSGSVFARNSNLHLYIEVIPPHVYYEGERLTGINFQIVERLCLQSELTCHFHHAPWARAYNKALKEPFTGVFSTALTPDRKPLFKWVGPLEPASSYLYKLSSNSADLYARQPEQVFKVATVRNSKMSEEIIATRLITQNELIEFADIQECIRMLAAGRVDFTAINELALGYHSSKLDLDSKNFVVASPALRKDAGNYIALNLSTPDIIVDKMNRTLATLEADPWLHKLRLTYQKH